MIITLNLFQNGAACRVFSFTLVSFIAWLDVDVARRQKSEQQSPLEKKRSYWAIDQDKYTTCFGMYIGMHRPDTSYTRPSRT
jgi:hypothetical protein